MDRFVPLFARVVIERPKKEKEGSIIIPDGVQKKYAPTKGVLIDAGEGCCESVKDIIGKTVYFAKYAGDWLEVGGKEIFICQDEDILGVIEQVQ